MNSFSSRFVGHHDQTAGEVPKSKTGQQVRENDERAHPRKGIYSQNKQTNKKQQQQPKKKKTKEETVATCQKKTKLDKKIYIYKRNVYFFLSSLVVVNGLHDGRYGRHPRKHGQSQNP